MFATPTPRVLYIHDDLSDELGAHGEASLAWPLWQALLAVLRRHPERVVILTLAEQLDAVVAHGEHPPFATAVGIGSAGARVAAQLHARTGWFPAIHRIDIWREEDASGGYALAGPAPLAGQLAALGMRPELALVDDTIFSGLTMRSVLAALPSGLSRHTRVFCLRALAESLNDITRLAPVTPGFVAPGRILEDVSFINASGLVRRHAIRRAGQPGLAFFERPEWMQAWFPGYHEEVIELSSELSAQLELSPTHS
jgi:hypothetical protein